MALTENISPPGPEVAFGSPLSTFVCCGMEEGGGREGACTVPSFAKLIVVCVTMLRVSTFAFLRFFLSECFTKVLPAYMSGIARAYR